MMPTFPGSFERFLDTYESEWKEAMSDEIKAIMDRNTWTVIEKSQLPLNARVVHSTWAFRIKRYLNGDFRKFKARFWVRGDLQKKAVNETHSYTPVAQLASVRKLLLRNAHGMPRVHVSSARINS